MFPGSIIFRSSSLMSSRSFSVLQYWQWCKVKEDTAQTLGSMVGQYCLHIYPSVNFRPNAFNLSGKFIPEVLSDQLRKYFLLASDLFQDRQISCFTKVEHQVYQNISYYILYFLYNSEHTTHSMKVDSNKMAPFPFLLNITCVKLSNIAIGQPSRRRSLWLVNTSLDLLKFQPDQSLIRCFPYPSSFTWV